MEIVLVEPEIPQNTGNIGRTCVATDTKLHLVRPFGFVLDEKAIRRSGMDYWQYLNLEIHDSIEDFLAKYGHRNLYLATTKGSYLYSDAEFKEDDMILFGAESRGLPKILMDSDYKKIRIPMSDIAVSRSLNLSNSVNIILFEGLRQLGFKGLV